MGIRAISGLIEMEHARLKVNERYACPFFRGATQRRLSSRSRLNTGRSWPNPQLIERNHESKRLSKQDQQLPGSL